MPLGNANGFIFFGWTDGSGHRVQQSGKQLNEAPISGWYYITDNFDDPSEGATP